MKKITLITILLLSAFLFGQDIDDQGRTVKYRKKTVIDFEDVMLEGQIKKPSGSFLMDRSKRSFNSLIRLKKNFNKELVKSVDLLK